MPSSPHGGGGGASLEIEMVLLAPDGARFKQHILPPFQFGSCAAVLDMALEAWAAATQHQPTGALRVEAVKYDGDRVMLTRHSPQSALRSVAELRVSAGAIEGSMPASSLAGHQHAPPPASHGSSRPQPSQQTPLGAMDESRYVQEATRAANAAIERTAVEATATSSVLRELMEQLAAAGPSSEATDNASGSSIAGATGEGGSSMACAAGAAACAAAVTTQEAISVASSLAAPMADRSAIGEDVLPPVLLEQMRPKLALALQQAAALAVRATEERSELALKGALEAAEGRHKTQLEAVLQAAQASSQRERTSAVEKVVSKSHEQSQELISRAVHAARLEEARKFDVLKERAVTEAVKMEQAKAETARKMAIEQAIKATENQQSAMRERAIEEAEQRTATQWRSALRQSEKAVEERAEATLQRARGIESEAKTSGETAEAKLRTASSEVWALKTKLEETELRRQHTEKSLEKRIKAELERQEAEHKKQEEAAVMSALKSYDRRALDEKAFAVKGAADEAKLQAEQERLLMLDTMAQTENRYKEQLVAEFKRGHEAGKREAAAEMAGAEKRVAMQARAKRPYACRRRRLRTSNLQSSSHWLRQGSRRHLPQPATYRRRPQRKPSCRPHRL